MRYPPLRDSIAISTASSFDELAKVLP